MRWNMRLVAAQRGIWKASDLQRLLAEHGLVISAGKMSGLWSGQPVTVKLADLDVICVVLGCQVGDLLIPEPDTVSRPAEPGTAAPKAVGGAPMAVVPRRRDAGPCRRAEPCLRADVALPTGWPVADPAWRGARSWPAGCAGRATTSPPARSATAAPAAVVNRSAPDTAGCAGARRPSTGRR